VGATVRLSQHAEQILPLLERAKEQPEVPTAPRPNAFEPSRRLTDSQIQDLARRYIAGASVAELSRDLGLHRSTVYVRLERAGIRLRPREALSPSQAARAAVLYEGGASLVAVGREFGVDAQTVRNHLAKAGIEIRKRRGWPRRTSS
jgi:transposase-like protein